MTYEVAVRAEATLGEGPTWDAAAGRLIWIDILGSRVHTYDPSSGRRTVRVTDQHVGAAKPRVGGGLVLNLRDGVGLVDPDGEFRWLHREPVAGRRANDAAVAPDGALWVGTMRYDEAVCGGTLSRVTGDGSVQLILDDVAVSNGTGWSPDGRLMYYIDSPTRRIDVFEYADGRVSKRRRFTDIEAGAGFPDGLTVDADGCVCNCLVLVRLLLVEHIIRNRCLVRGTFPTTGDTRILVGLSQICYSNILAIVVADC